MKRKAKLNLNLTKFIVYMSIFIFVSIFANLIVSVNAYKSEIYQKNKVYTDYVMLNNLAVTDSSVHVSEGYFDYIYDRFIHDSNANVIRTDLPSFSTDSLIDVYRYHIDDASNLSYKEINSIIEQNKKYNINKTTEDKVIFFYQYSEFKYPIIVMYQDSIDGIRLVALFRMPHQTKFFDNLNNTLNENEAYYFFIEQTDHVIPFNKMENSSSVINDLSIKDSKHIHSVESSNYYYQCAYYIDSSKSNGYFLLIVSLFSTLNILFFVAFILIYNRYKRSKLQSTTDEDTGLYNRRYLFAKVSNCIKRKQYPISFIVVDVDYLKFINDTYGHLKGDEAINKIAGILKTVFRENDIVARIGGDEFAILVDDATKDVVMILLERIRKCIEDENAKNPDELPISASTGFYVSEGEIEDTEALFKKADDDMYNRKEVSHKEYEARLIKWCKKHNIAPPKPRK